MTGTPEGSGMAPTPWQRHMWLSQRVRAGRVDLNAVAAVYLSGPLDVDALDRAIRRVADRYPLLRSHFPVDATGMPRRVVAATSDGPHRTALVDEPSVGPDDPRVRLRVRRLLHHVFDLTTETPLRSELIDLGGGRHVLAVVAHHLACDEPGIGWWFEQVAAAYRGDTRSADADAVDVTTAPPVPSRSMPSGGAPGLPASGLVSPELVFPELVFPELVFPGEDPTRRMAGRSTAVDIPLSGDAVDGLDRACARTDVTPAEAVAAAAIITVGRLCGTNDLAVATSLSATGATPPGPAATTAHCVIDRIARVDDAVRAIGRALSAPSAAPVGPESGLGTRRASTDVDVRLRAVHHRAIDPIFADDIAVRVLTTDTGHTAYPLTVDVGPDLRLLHDPSVVSAPVAAALAEATALLLEAFVDWPDRAVIDVPTARAATRDRMLARSHGRPGPIPPTTVLEAVARRLHDDPTAEAVIDAAAVADRARIDHESRVLARRLLHTGARAGAVVATLLDPSVAMVVAALAILRIGAVYLPIDRRANAAVVNRLIQRARPDVVVVERRDDAPASVTVPVVAIGGHTADDGPPTSDVDAVIHPGQPAYLVPARADAADPPLVAISHGALAEYVGWLGRLVDLQPDESVLQVAPAGFDVGIAEIFGCLTAGIRLVIPQVDRAQDMGYLTDLIGRHRVATMHVVPSQLVNLLAQRGIERWTSLRCIPVGGEPLPARLANRFTAGFDATLHNFYGVTEMTLAAGHHEVTAASGHGFVPIGGPKDNTRILVLDDRLRPVPEGIIGDIYVGGSQLATGYHRQSAATAARFVADPFHAGSRLFRTGDRGRWIDQGLDYCGRDDHLVVAGRPVPRREVERVVADTLDARTAVVDLVGPRDMLVAWVVDPSEDVADTGVRERLATVLPDHMVPAVVVALERIPLTATGTIDRSGLPIPEAPTPAPGRSARTPTERRICRIVAEVAGRTVHLDDSVTGLGWGAVTATELACRLSATFGTTVGTDDVLRWSTPAAMAAAIDTATLVAAVDPVTTGPIPRPSTDDDPHTRVSARSAVPRAGAPTLVVVGAGPKGIAVAVKAAVLRDAGLPAPRVIIVERCVIGANWTAAGGWTDGSQRLGTSPEKDLGFPYRSAEFRGFNRAVDQAAQRFSWAAYLVAAGTFGEWVDRGRPAPRHREWARYLQWAADQAGVEVVIGEVSGLSIENGRWRVDLGAHGEPLDADAVMVTGPGSAVSDWESLGPRVVGPASFWRSVVARAVPSAARTAVIGAGETAGAILHEMSRQEVASISVVAPRASLFTRGEGYFENRVFTDSVRWESLSITQRREVIDRADRGVLSTRVMDEIRLDGRIAHLEGRVRSARTAADGIRLGIDTSAGPIERDFDWVIDARGTRDLWMLDLLDAGARDRLERAIGGPASLDRLQLSVGRDLAVEGLFPQLFTPSLAALRQGPGFPNLSCLGLLADRICAGIVRAPQEITHEQKTEDDAADPRPSAERRQGWTLV